MDARVPPQGARALHAAPDPDLGGNLAQIDWDDIHYFVRASEKSSRDWDDVPEDIKKTFDRLGIPEAERQFLAGVGAQYESEVVYHQVREDLEKQGVLFLDMDSGLREHEDIVREYWATVIPPNDNKLAALNSAVWSGGSFVYVPKGVKVEMPLQAYFRINTENMGQFERTLIIAEEGSTSTTSRAARPRSTRPTRCIPRWSRSSASRARASVTRRSRTGRRTSTTWSPSGPLHTRTRRWSGSTATWARS